MRSYARNLAKKKVVIETEITGDNRLGSSLNTFDKRNM